MSKVRIHVDNNVAVLAEECRYFYKVRWFGHFLSNHFELPNFLVFQLYRFNI